MKPVLVGEEACEKIREACCWYESQKWGLGSDFIAEDDKAIGVIGVFHTPAMLRHGFGALPEGEFFSKPCNLEPFSGCCSVACAIPRHSEGA